MTKLYETDTFYKALVGAMNYNLGFKYFEETFYKPFLNLKDGEYFSNLKIDEVKDWNLDECANQYWCIFVLMFGDYGTSPRGGWIIKNEKSLNFFENLYNDLKELN